MCTVSAHLQTEPPTQQQQDATALKEAPKQMLDPLPWGQLAAAAEAEREAAAAARVQAAEAARAAAATSAEVTNMVPATQQSANMDE